MEIGSLARFFRVMQSLPLLLRGLLAGASSPELDVLLAASSTTSSFSSSDMLQRFLEERAGIDARGSHVLGMEVVVWSTVSLDCVIFFLLAI